MRIGFMGFGEAASAIAAGLHDAGIEEIVAYDAFATDVTRERAEQIGVHLLDDIADFGDLPCSVIFCLVPGSEAVSAAQQIVPYVDSNCVYADLTSCSPKVKNKIGGILAQKEVLFASVAVMSAVPPLRHRVPMLADGKGASRLIESMAPFGMNVRGINGQLGASAAVKMCRSILVKGLEALFLESLTVAEQIGVGDEVLQSVEQSFGDLSFPELANYLLARNFQHGRRRAHELREAANTAKEFGIEPYATFGAARRLEESASNAQRLTYHGPGHDNRDTQHITKSYKEVLRLLHENQLHPS